jgi:RNA polymerase sigma-70 factor (ECF subfamily)
MSGNASDAEEIAQDAFLLAYRGIGTFQGESLFRTWLTRIAVNRALMHRRSARRRPLQPLEPSMLFDVAHFVAAEAGDVPEGADVLADRKAAAERVHEALAQLEESQRIAIVLRDLEERSAEESAHILGVSPDTVRQRAHRARLRLRELLDPTTEQPATIRSRDAA